MKLVELHLTPEPFQDRASLSSVCKPDIVSSKVHRPEAAKALYAITVLLKWSALSLEERSKYLGPEGINQHGTLLGRFFVYFQNQDDRIFVADVGIATSVFYFMVPLSYYCASLRTVAALLFTIYALCVFQVVTCIVLFAVRTNFIVYFERSMPSWKGQLDNYIQLISIRPGASTE